MGPAIPLIASVAAAAIPEITKLTEAKSQRKRSEQYSKVQRPKYEIPENIKKYLAQTKFRAGAVTLPGQGQIEAKMGRQMASSARGIQESGQSSGAILQALAGLNQQGIQQQADLGVQGAQMQDRRMGDLYGAQRAMAVEEGKQFLYDEDEPYRNAMKLAQELDEASRSNRQVGIEGLSGIAQSVFMGGLSSGLFDKKPGDKDNLLSTSNIANYFDPNAVYGTGASKPMETFGYDNMFGEAQGFTDYGNQQIELPPSITNGFNSQYYGMPVTDEMSDYYNLGGGFNNLFNSIFRRRGSERTRTYKR